MGFLDSVRSWLQRERAEVSDALDGTRRSLEADLDRREAELQAGPSERLQQLQDRIAAGDDQFDQLRDKIEFRAERADAVGDLASADPEPADQNPADADPVAD